MAPVAAATACLPPTPTIAMAPVSAAAPEFMPSSSPQAVMGPVPPARVYRPTTRPSAPVPAAAARPYQLPLPTVASPFSVPTASAPNTTCRDFGGRIQNEESRKRYEHIVRCG